MEYNVVFFSRTGNTKRVAQKIAKRLGVKEAQIKDDMNWNGIFGFLKAGRYSYLEKSVSIRIDGEYDLSKNFVVVSPLWAGKLPPATNEFLKLVQPDKVHLVITCKGSEIEKLPFVRRGEFKGYYGIVKHLKNEEKGIEEILRILKNDQ